MRFYIGVKQDYSREVFKAPTTPTETTHGALYLYAIGPFVTKRGALWGAQRGAYWYTIAQAEREAKKQARPKQDRT